MVGKQERRYQRMITVVLALISLIMVIPLVLLVVASFTSNNEIVLHGYSFFPKELSLKHTGTFGTRGHRFSMHMESPFW